MALGWADVYDAIMRLKQLLTTLIALCGVASGVGCARTESFDIAVRNDTTQPVTLILAKNGPPFEQLWAAPEDLALESPDNEERHSYFVLEPNRTADLTVKGKFEQGSRGLVRVYRGDLDLSALIAIGPASPNRIDLRLRPGVNRFVVFDDHGRLAARDAPDVPPPPPPPPQP